MKIRCDVHLGPISSKLVLVPKPEEKLDHLALKLAGYVMFLERKPLVEPSSDHPALSGFDIKPDVMALNIYGQVDLWVECGAVTLHNLDKVSRRFPSARMVVLKATAREAERLRAGLTKETRYGKRIEVWYWPEGRFGEWMKALDEKTELFGEAHEKFFNLVVNERTYVADLLEV